MRITARGRHFSGFGTTVNRHKISSVRRMFGSITPKVLSVQSHTTHGYVGNKAATFPLQTLGFNVDCINTISLSNEPGYTGGFKGHSMNRDQLHAIVEGLSDNTLLNHDVILTGYTSKQELLDETEEIVKRVKLNNPSAIYLCDPVMGDHGRYYVPQELCDKYRRQILPLATVITPNYFEAQELSGVQITSLATAVEACKALLELGPQICVLTGLSLEPPAADGSRMLTVLLAYKNLRVFGGSEESALNIYRLDFARIDNTFNGCGDLFSALLAAGIHRTRSALAGSPQLLGHLLEIVTQAMSVVLSHTKHLQTGTGMGSRELRIVECAPVYRSVGDRYSSLLAPAAYASVSARTEAACFDSVAVHRSHVAVSSGKLVGVIFDMDGTLTMPHLINFKAMWERNGLVKTPECSDILTAIERLPSEDARREALNVLLEEEMIGCENMEFRPHMHHLLASLQQARVRMAVCTRNCDLALDKFIQRAGLERDTFAPNLTRESTTGLNKPDPALARHIMAQWNIQSGQEAAVWFVGDSVDDMQCGKGAGCRTCLITSRSSDKIMAEHGHLVDLRVDTLEEFEKYVLGAQ